MTETEKKELETLRKLTESATEYTFNYGGGKSFIVARYTTGAYGPNNFLPDGLWLARKKEHYVSGGFWKYKNYQTFPTAIAAHNAAMKAEE